MENLNQGLGHNFTVAILDDCKVCGSKIDKTGNKRLRSYCSKECRDKWHRRKLVESGYSREVQRKAADAKAAEASIHKKKCGICGRWYRKVASHITQRHGMDAREYKEHMDLPTTHGILPEDLRERLSQNAKDNDMHIILPTLSPETRFVLGGERQRGPKPRAGKIFVHNDYY